MKSDRVVYNMQILANNITLLRKKHRLSKVKMAKILNISVNSLSKIEAGVIPPRLKVGILFHIRDHFELSIQSLFQPQDTE